MKADKTNRELTEFVLENGAKHEGAHGWIQWKGTLVCMDITCQCGHFGHVDGDFFYHYQCPACKRIYGVDGHTKLIELPEEYHKAAQDCLKTDTD